MQTRSWATGWLAMAGVWLALAGAVLAENENEWLEEYVLKDRAAALAKLIPGTADYYFYHALDALVGKRQADYEKFIADFRAKHRGDPRLQQLEARALVLLYEVDQDKALTELIRRFGISFGHVKPGDRAARTQYPSALDPAKVATKTYIDLIKNRPDRLGELTDAGRALVFQATADERVKDVLLYDHLADPTVPNLIAEMVQRLSTGKINFMKFKAAPNLTLAQLQELARAVPGVLDDDSFVNAWMMRLRSDRNPTLAERDAQLDRQLAFANTLSPQFNALKANLMYARLRRNLETGAWDEALFKQYLAIPRLSPVVERKHVEGANARVAASLDQEWREATALGPIRDDRDLITEHLEHFLAGVEDPGDYGKHLDESYLKRTFATAKILAGNVDAKYVGMLAEHEIKELRERVELRLAPDNPRNFRPGEPVKLKLVLKHTPELVTKIYRLNAFNYFKAKKSEVASDFDVMGLKTDAEFTEKFDRPATTRFEYLPAKLADAAKAPGVYVIDFLAGGKNARAIVTVGRFFVVDQTVSTGVVLTVFDEDRKPVAGATLHVAGHEYTTDDDGRALLPFVKQSTPEAVIVRKGDICALDRFTHAAPDYRLVGGIFAERESLLGRTRAKVIVAPRLLSHGNAVPIARLEEPKLVIQAVDRNGVTTTQTVEQLSLTDSAELAHEFTVPPYLANLTITLSGKIELPWEQEKQELALSETITVHPATEPTAVGMPFLTRGERGLSLLLLGRNGEPVADEAVTFTFRNRHVNSPVVVTLVSDERGEISLGELPDLDSFSVRVVSTGAARNFDLAPEAPILPAKLYLEAGKPFALALPAATGLGQADFRLFKQRQGANEADVAARLKVADGQLTVDDLEAGEYRLSCVRTGQEIALSVGPVESRKWLMVGEKSVMHAIPVSKLNIAAIDEAGGKIRVKLAGAGAGTRVHLVGTFFTPAESLLDAVRGNYELPVWERMFPRPENIYLAARELDSEYLYILARKTAVKYPGNLLERPWLILNPVETQAVETRWATDKKGEAFGEGRAMPATYGMRSGAARRARSQHGGIGAVAGVGSLEFLQDPAVVLANLKPDQDGVVEVDAALFKNARHLVATALDPHGAVAQAKTLKGERPLVTTDLRVGNVLDSAQAFGQATLARAVAKGGKVAFRDRSSTEYQVVGTVAALHRLLMALNPGLGLEEFAFLGQWHQLAPDKKQELYSRYASHELTLFIAYKDPKFFNAVIRPYLKHKLHKPLVDECFTGGDLGRFRAPEERLRLNVLERILLDQKLGVKGPDTARWIADQFDLTDFPDEEVVRLIETALGSFGLEQPVETRAVAVLKEAEAGEFQPKFKAVGGRGLAPGAPPPAAAAAMDATRMEQAKKTMEKADRAYFAEEQLAAKPQKAVAMLFRNVDRTKEYMEMGYFRKPGEPTDFGPDLVAANPFWADFARTEAKPVLSANAFYAHRTRAEALLVLALTDLPFAAAEPVEKADGAGLEVTVAENALVFSREIAPLAGKAADETAPLMLSIRHFLLDEGRTFRPGEEPSPVAEFLPGRAYYADITVTNPSAKARKCDVLYQVPGGAIAFNQKEKIKNLKVTLQAYGTFNHRFNFYFPATGEFKHYQTLAYERDRVVASTGAKTLKVVATPTVVDRENWDWVALNGANDDVIKFLEKANLGRIQLDKAYFRLADKAFYLALRQLLASRQAYDPTVAAYAFKHRDLPGMRDFLKRSPLADEIGGYLEAKLLALDPVADGDYRHLEYAPLVIPRTHTRKGEPTIFIENLKTQYRTLLDNLATKAAPGDPERLELAYYFLLQNRIEEAAALAAAVKPASVDQRLQLDYLNCYLHFFNGQPADAKQVAEGYRDYGVPRWRDRFREVLAQLAEIEGGARADDEQSREAKLAKMAGAETALDFKVENGKLVINHENAKAARLNLYEMDVEELFSRNPFAKNYAERFAFVQPSQSQEVKLVASGRTEVAIPGEYRKRDVFVELVAGNVSRGQLVLASNLDVTAFQNSGRVRVLDRANRKPLARIYVKVYALIGGDAVFYKDGYTDLRGVFDYATLSDNQIDRTEKFAVLVLSDTHGSVILETPPPKQ